MSSPATEPPSDSKDASPDTLLSVNLSHDVGHDPSLSGIDRLKALARHLGRLAGAEAMRASMMPALHHTTETNLEHGN